MDQNKLVKPFPVKEIPIYEKGAPKGSYGFYVAKAYNQQEVGKANPHEGAFFIEGRDFETYLQYFAVRSFNKKLQANEDRACSRNNNENYFQIHKESNFYNYGGISKIMEGLKNTIQCFMSGIETEFTKNYSHILNTIRVEVLGKSRLSVKGHYDKEMSKTFSEEIRVLINFYNRVIIKLERLMDVADERGVSLIRIVRP